MADLRQPRVTLVYGFDRIGASGRIADRAITSALAAG